jgi:hypothetical protein
MSLVMVMVDVVVENMSISRGLRLMPPFFSSRLYRISSPPNVSSAWVGVMVCAYKYLSWQRYIVPQEKSLARLRSVYLLNLLPVSFFT